MAALAGAVTLGSCVKDDVSSSVEAVRNAKAAQLNGQATASAAQAKLYEAQAAFQNAQAAAENADTELTKVRTLIEQAQEAYNAQVREYTLKVEEAQAARDAAQAALAEAQAKINAANAEENAAIALEDAKTTLERSKVALAAAQRGEANAQAKAEAQLAADLADLQATLINNQDAIQTNLNNLAGTMRNGATAQGQAIANALNNYNLQLGAYYTAERNVVTQKANLAKAKISAENAVAYKESFIRNQTDAIKASEAKIAAYKKIQASGKTQDELDADKVTSAQELKNAVIALESSEELTALIKASADFAEKWEAVDKLEDVIIDANMIATWAPWIFNPYGTDKVDPVVNLTGGVVGAAYDKFVTYEYDTFQTDANFANPAYNGVFNLYRVDEGEYNNSITSLNANIDNRQTALDNHKDELGTESDTKDTKRKVKKTYDLTMYAQLALFKDSVTNSKKRLDAEIAKFDAAKAELATADALADTDATKAGKQIAAKKKMGDALKAIYGDNGTTFVDPTNPTAAEVENYINLWGWNAPLKAEDFDKTFDEHYLTEGYGSYNILYRGDGSRPNNSLQFIYDDARENVADMTQQIANKKETIAAFEVNLANAKQDLADFEEAFKAVDLTAYATACDDLKASLEAFNKAAEAFDAKRDIVDEKNAVNIALQAVNLEAKNIDDMIKAEEDAIANAKRAIEVMVAAMDDPDTIIATAEAQLDEAVANAESLKAELEAYKKIVEDLLALADDADDEGDEEPTDEPASEGGEG